MDSTCTACRSAGKKLMLKGEKCNSPKCALVQRNYPAGFHGNSTKRKNKVSQFGQQLAEKQHAKKIYGMREKQFRLFFERGNKKGGDAGENLLRLLEMRLDNVIYRLGIASSRPQARQMVSHAQFLVNDKKVNIASYIVKEGDIIKIKKSKRSKKTFVDVLTKVKAAHIPGWLNFDVSEEYGKVLHAPGEADFDKTINRQAIVEFYSK
ncbi:30S ribosomal protein S4 [Candidatus Falkowbacteria bacterium CG10_big_fil_rev_8_21_14_0_10_37_14]|uniref:Small ribosomal subunit protein uS4 n=1 Tax=Candidatus Falkowbacteria bacterium CG10_big_fil_rev_8_21_14_0_10_37_14 TaxID=1974561 RepID=A0A2M6WSK3_9BACT|nr:30S ribosomal protein S4 [Candidatus Falkowbacteria bacterium]PIT95751.1 MAG: 30S ribosomal protein S4 [Candidatus Falkowbacteria bacterium CG10_big_fil_rev_8_21_14_0_10_37_14]